VYERIITHNDFDGIVSAAICAHVLSIRSLRFVGPRAITESRIFTTRNDVVCDLPYPLECGLWFDHHEGNVEELKYRGVDPEQVEGAFALLPSCSRVVYNYFSGTQNLPDRFEKMVQEADVIDTFGYQNIEEWRKETPGKIVEGTLKVENRNSKEQQKYMTGLVFQLKDQPLDQVAQLAEVRERYKKFLEEESRMIQQIHDNAHFLPEDEHQELVILDLTRYNRKPSLVKHLAYLLFPEALGVIEIKNLFQREIKTNNLSLSMSLSLNLNGSDHKKDVGEIMRILNIGDGHKGAGAGVVRCSSKDEMVKRKESILRQIYQIWRTQ